MQFPGRFNIECRYYSLANVVCVRFRESSFHFHSLFSRRIEVLFRLSFQGKTNCSFFSAHCNVALTVVFGETIVTILSEVWELIQRLVLICCHRHTLRVGPGVASIALKPAATALFLAFDTVVLRYGATTADLAYAIRYETFFIKFVTTIRLNTNS